MQNKRPVPVQLDTLITTYNSMGTEKKQEHLLEYLQQLDYQVTAGLCLNDAGELFFDDKVCQETLCRAKTRDEVQTIMNLFFQLVETADALGRSVNDLKAFKEAASENAPLSINIGPRGADEDHKIISMCSTFVSGLKDFYDEWTVEGGMRFGTPSYEPE